MVFDKVNKSFGILFLFILLIEVISNRNAELSTIHTVAMPLLLAYLFLFFYLRRDGVKKVSKICLLIALGSAFIGDILLSKEISIFRLENNSGMIFHGLAHLSLVVLFYNERNIKTKGYNYLLLLFIIGGIYMYLNYKFQYNTHFSLENLLQLILILMIIFFSILRKDNVPRDSFILILSGSLLLLSSFMFLSFRKFLEFNTHDLIMVPYSLSFLCFVTGILKEN